MARASVPRPVQVAPGLGRRQRRQHGVRQPFDRRQLERAGWRTTLEYRENAERDVDGRLTNVVAHWCAEGEFVDADGDVSVVVATGPSAATAWSRLRAGADRVAKSAHLGELQGA